MTNREKKARASRSFGDVLASAQPVERSVRICLDGSLLAELDRLNAELAEAKAEDARENRLPQAPAVAQRIVELTEKAKADEVEFTFRALGQRAWRDLVAAHAPTEEQRKEGHQYNPDTFFTAAIAASLVEPTGVTADDAGKLLDMLTESQQNSLWLACLAANRGPSDVPFIEAAFALARPTEPSSAPPAPMESLEASS